MNNIDDIWERSALAAANLQRIADQMTERAKSRDLYGISNNQLDQQLEANHYEALKKVLEIGDQLERAAIEAGILRKPPEGP